MDGKHKPNDWGPEHEKVLSEWADKANCYQWLHTKCNEKFHSLHIWYTIPVIIMSTLTGTANFAQSKIPVGFQGYATMIIGGVNIMAGIITTIQQFLKINELNESHRVASLAWDKFYRRLKVELSKKPKERQDVSIFFSSATEEYDRLMEASPMIEKDILRLFDKVFKGKFEKDFAKPEICDDLVSVKNTTYKESDEEKKSKLMKNLVGDMMSVQTERQCTENQFIKEFYDKFKVELQRQPTQMELVNNLVNDPTVHHLHITEDAIQTYLATLE
jgi:hypothetical protein